MSILDVKRAKILGDGSLNSCSTSKKRNIKPISYAAAGSICLVRLRYSSKLQQMKRLLQRFHAWLMFTSVQGIAVKNGNPVCCDELLFTTVSRSITLHLERILWASPGFKQIKDRFLTWFVHSTFHYRRFDISTLFKRPRMFCLATTTVLINFFSIKLRLSCETFQFSSVL